MKVSTDAAPASRSPSTPAVKSCPGKGGGASTADVPATRFDRTPAKGTRGFVTRGRIKHQAANHTTPALRGMLPPVHRTPFHPGSPLSWAGGSTRPGLRLPPRGKPPGQALPWPAAAIPVLPAWPATPFPAAAGYGCPRPPASGRPGRRQKAARWCALPGIPRGLPG